MKSEVPEWVFVWWWARRSRAPRMLRPFPQMQSEAIDQTSMLSDEEYAAVRKQWIEAGAPKVALSDIVQANVGGRSMDEIVEILKETAP